MLISSRGRLGDLGAATEGPELFPGELRPVATFETPASTMTIDSIVIRPAASALATIAPKKIGPTGKVTIWGLPPMVAYAIMAVTVTGAGMWAYQHFSGGRRLATNPRPRRAPRAKRARYKR